MKKKFILGIGFVAAFSFLFAITSSIAWFDNKQTIKTEEVIAQTKGAYYASGSGTQDDPYIINQPVHLYNLAWLQYMGLYNEDDNSDGKVDQYYFKVEGNKTENENNILDMSGWTLPPIGTQDDPFVGDFDGNNVIIKNLTISNDEKDFTGNSVKPEKVTTFTKPSIIGFFGVIGAVDSQTYDYSSTSNLAYDTYIDNITIKNGDEQKTVLAGLFAGFVNAEIKNCGVGYGKFNFADGTTNIATTPAQTDEEGTTTNSNVSNYTLVGAYNPKNFSWTAPSGKGNENDWGGSIDFEMLNQRLTYIMANSTKSTYSYKSDRFNTNIYYTSSTAFNFTTASLQTAILNSDTYLPLNVDNSTINESYYKTASNESVLTTNTGYIVGEGTTSNGYLRSMHNKTNKDNAVVNGSFYTLNSKKESPSQAESITSSNISFLWLDNDGKTYRIRDNDNKDNFREYIIPSNYSSSYSSGSYGGIKNNGKTETVTEIITENKEEKEVENTYEGLNLVKYEDVKKNFVSSLDVATTSNFFDDNKNRNIALNYLQLKTKTEPTAKTYNDITLNGKTGSYDLFSGGINYTLTKDGYMSMLCGMSYQGGGQKGNLADIYYVDTSGSTKQLKKIYKIIKKSGTIAYKFDNSSLSNDEELVFDLNKMSTSNLLEIGCIYYFEFPMIAGDYFMTRYDSSTSVYVPYIYYLDIGANAGDDSGRGTDTSLPKVDFVYYNDSKTLVKITDNGYIKSQIVFKIPSSVSGLFEFNRTSSTTVLYYIAFGNTITPVADSKEVSATKSDSELTEN